jgi:hypothetical protein
MLGETRGPGYALESPQDGRECGWRVVASEEEVRQELGEIYVQENPTNKVWDAQTHSLVQKGSSLTLQELKDEKIDEFAGKAFNALGENPFFAGSGDTGRDEMLGMFALLTREMLEHLQSPAGGSYQIPPELAPILTPLHAVADMFLYAIQKKMEILAAEDEEELTEITWDP